jgi:hypothetical protein
MSGGISPLHQYAFMAWCSVKSHGQLYLYQIKEDEMGGGGNLARMRDEKCIQNLGIKPERTSPLGRPGRI